MEKESKGKLEGFGGDRIEMPPEMMEIGKPADPRDWPGPAPEVADSDITEILEADVVVVGGGHAGLQCALAAAECGAEVIVIEKKAEDCMTWMGEQIGTFNSRLLTERGFGGYDLDAIIEEFCRCNAYYINRALIAKYVKNSGELLDHWASLVPEGCNILHEDQCNVHAGPEGTVYPIVRGGYRTWAATLQFRGDPVTTRDVRYRVNQFSRLPEMCRFALDESLRLGADWRFGHTAVVLRKEQGRVSGVVAKAADGHYVLAKARRGVALTLGCFGDQGFRLGVWAGGHMDNTPLEVQRRAVAGRRGPGGGGGSPFGQPSFLRLNAAGKRYCNECVPYGNALERQPAGISCWITDKKWLEELKLGGLQHGNADFGMPLYIEQVVEDMSHVAEHGCEGYGVRSGGLSEREQSVVYGAETLEELCDIFGYEGEARENFFASVARYNELCRDGYDADFGKDADCLFPVDEGPFYGSFAVSPSGGKWERADVVSNGVNGLASDDELRVTDDDGWPIPGLYTAGANLGYLHSVFYSTPCGGNYIGMAATLGRQLGLMLGAKE